MSPVKKVQIVLSVVGNEYKVPISEIMKPNHTGHPNNATEAKYVAMYLIKSSTYYQVTKIGEMFGYNPASGHKGIPWVEAKLFTDPDFKRRVSKLEAILPQIFNIHK